MRTCGYCGGSGHNRRTCEQLKKNHPEHVERREKILAERKRVRDERNAARGIPRRACSFCFEPGHNRKTCPALKKEIEAIKKNVAEFRLWFKSNLIEKGYGVGAVVKMEHDPSFKSAYSAGYEKDAISEMKKKHGLLGVIIGYNVEGLYPWEAIPSSTMADEHMNQAQWDRFSDTNLNTWSYTPGTNGGKGAACHLRVLFPNGEIRHMPVGKEFSSTRMRSASSLHLVCKSTSEEHCAKKIDNKFSEELSAQEIKDIMQYRNYSHGSLVRGWE